MSDAADRTRRLARLQDVQSKLRRIAEWRLADAERNLRAVETEERLVFESMNADEALGGLFVDVRARRLKRLAEDAARAEALRDRQRHSVLERTRREKSGERLSAKAADAAEAELRKTELNEVIDSVLSLAPQASGKTQR